MLMNRFSRDALQAMPWKNGGGVTQEVVCWPEGAGMDTFDWRISIARIASDGPFSAFPGVDRVITLLDGAGVRLLSSEGGFDHSLDVPLQPFAFAGDVPVEARLLAGTCSDFNVMTRRNSCRSAVTVCRESLVLETCPAGLLMAVQGRWLANGQILSPGQGLWWESGGHSWSLESADNGAALLAVTIDKVRS